MKRKITPPYPSPVWEGEHIRKDSAFNFCRDNTHDPVTVASLIWGGIGWGRWWLLTLLLSTLILFAGCSNLTMRGYYALHSAEINQRVSNDYHPLRFRVEAGDPARLIGQKLKEAGLINDDLLFEAYVRSSGVSTRLSAGIFVLSPDMTLAQIVDELLRADAGSVTVTIREGWRVEQIADSLAAANVFNDLADGKSDQAEAYRQIVTSGVLPEGIDASRYTFLNSRPQNTSLEGFLFPDTYLLPAEGATALDLVTRQLDAFAEKVEPLYQEAVVAKTTSYDLYSVLILASIVEREAVVAEERPVIAGVYLNRLAQSMKLEADPTVQYALGYQANSGQWWKTPIYLEDYSNVDSPYNTYLYTGLPPGPIACPGLESIRAVLEPAQHNYLFFVALPDGSGRHVFAETFEEHQQNVQKYMRGG
ncbi:MAG: endolytic transglycosylase MltG [Caldilineaceae bacterium]